MTQETINNQEMKSDNNSVPNHETIPDKDWEKKLCSLSPEEVKLDEKSQVIRELKAQGEITNRELALYESSSYGFFVKETFWGDSKENKTVYLYPSFELRINRANILIAAGKLRNCQRLEFDYLIDSLI